MASELAEAISEAVDSTANYAELIDRVIAEHAELSCSYCREITFKGRAVDSEKWSDAARKAMTDHVLTCPARPEQKLLDLVSTLCDALEVAINTVECDSLDAQGNELPWYAGAKKALALAGRPHPSASGERVADGVARD